MEAALGVGARVDCWPCGHGVSCWACGLYNAKPSICKVSDGGFVTRR